MPDTFSPRVPRYPLEAIITGRFGHYPDRNRQYIVIGVTQMPNLNRKVTVAMIFIAVLVIGVSIARADVLVKSRQTAAGQTYENQIMIKGKRQRTESMNGQMITIQQCDLRRDL